MVILSQWEDYHFFCLLHIEYFLIPLRLGKSVSNQADKGSFGDGQIVFNRAWSVYKLQIGKTIMKRQRMVVETVS